MVIIIGRYYEKEENESYCEYESIREAARYIYKHALRGSEDTLPKNCAVVARSCTLVYVLINT